MALAALFAVLPTFIEYNATDPGLIEFRDAPPCNRTRYRLLLAMVAVLALIQRSMLAPSPPSTLMEALGLLIGQALHFPGLPIRLATLILAGRSGPEEIIAVRSGVGVAYLILLLALAVFAMLLKLSQWPAHKCAFNVWTNLPTFDPTAGRDVVTRLERGAILNLTLGFLLPFLIPMVVRMGGMGLGSVLMSSPQTLIWIMSPWAFLLASLVKRGTAMGRIAGMIRDKREPGLEGSQGYVTA